MSPTGAILANKSQSDSRNSPGTPAAIALIVIAGIAAYSNSFSCPFLFDDNLSIRDNESIRRLWPIGPVLTEATTATVTGRPLLNLSLALNFALGGLNVWGYHAFNLAVHLIAASLLFCVVQRTFLLPSVPPSLRQDAWGLSLAIALIWMIHPLQTESVTYVVQRAESIAGVFYFLTLYCVIRAATGLRSVWWSIAAVTSCAVGMASKEVLATAPLIVLLYDRVFLSPSFAEIWRRRRGHYVGLVSTWFFMAALMISSRGRNGSAGFGLGMRSWDYAVTQFGFIVRYLRLSLWPDALVFDYGSEIAHAPSEIVPYAILVTLLLVMTVVALRYWPAFGFLGVWFFLILAPSSSIVPLVTQTGAEHRMYLPLAAVVVLVVLLGHSLFRSVAQRVSRNGARPGFVRGASIAAIAVVAIGLGCRTYARNDDYRSALSIWEDTAQKWPTNVRAHDTVGREYSAAGKLPQAIKEFNVALQLDPKSAPTYFNRGNAFALAGQYQSAIEDYNRLIAMQPENSEAYYQRGSAYGLLGRNELALEDFSRAVQVRPDHLTARFMCGKVNQHLRRYRDAVRDFTNLIERRPIDPEAYDYRGQCRHFLGEVDQAIADYSTAIEQEPNYVDAYCHRAAEYAASRQTDLAVLDFSKAIAMMPNHLSALSGRAVCYFELGQIERARADVEMLRNLGGKVDPEFVKKLSRPAAGPD